MAVYLGKKADDSYVRVPNQWARDPHLSLKAKGLLTYLLSHQSGYELTFEQMVAECKDGKSAVYAAINELIKHGYLKRVQQRTPDGKLGDTDYYVADAPVTTASRFPASGKSESGHDQGERDVSAGQTASRFPAYGKTASGKSATKKTISKKTKDQEDEKTTSPLPPAAPDAPPGADTQGEGEGVSEHENQINDLVDTIHQIRPRWSKRKITEAITDSLDDGRPWDAIVERFPALAADPETRHPGRLAQDGPWWDDINQQPRTSQRADVPTYGKPRIQRPTHPFEPNDYGDCLHCPLPAIRHDTPTPQSTADKRFADAMAFAAKYAAEEAADNAAAQHD